MRYRDSQISQRYVDCANTLLIIYGFLIYLLYAVLVTMGAFNDNLRMQAALTFFSAILDFFIGASSMMAIAYLTIMVATLRVLKRNYSLLYYKLRNIVLLATAVQFLGLFLKVVYILISVIFDVPNEEQSKFLEIPQRLLFSIVPLTISSIVTVSVVEVGGQVNQEPEPILGDYEGDEIQEKEAKQSESPVPSVSTREKTTLCSELK